MSPFPIHLGEEFRIKIACEKCSGNDFEELKKKGEITKLICKKCKV